MNPSASPPDADSPSARLQIAADQIRMATKALDALARVIDDEDEMLDADVARLESRAVELMRTAARLANRLGLDGPWGIDILFNPPDELESRRARRPVEAAAARSVELEPIALLGPLPSDPLPVAPPRRVPPSVSPWKMMTVPTPPLQGYADPEDSAYG